MATPAHRIMVTRAARYYLMGERAGAEEVWFVLHGYSQLAAGFLRWFEPAQRPGRLIVAPEALSRAYFDETQARRVGASWMTKEDREAEIEDYVRYLDQLADEIMGLIPPRPRLEVHGFSQGAATACRWSAFGRHAVDRLVLWGGTVPPDLDLERLRNSLRDGGLVLATGDRDQFVSQDAIRNEHARLIGVGLPVTVRSFTGGHSVDRSTLVAIS
ncbi:MAG: alpha/beta hydrolase [Gemmatimonadales bacterium]